ncbi:MAG: hypothetical protein R3312_03905 [Gammaproteobacteria bacterium]|nr:hypothetical protein [Gammaproteobacteria bacterium]
MIDFISDIREQPWRPVNPVTGVSFLAAMAVLAWLIKAYGGFIPVIDHANLAFHEAGHLFFMPFGKTASLYGGTLGQLLMPLIVAAVFWKQRNTVSFALALAWFFQNFFNIARYMADARARELPLVGGGDHDWVNIFFKWNSLSQDVVIAANTRMIGAAGLFLVTLWLLWRWLNSDQTD